MNRPFKSPAAAPQHSGPPGGITGADRGTASVHLHLTPTIRNNQLPTAELAERLGVSPAEIDAIRALGQYFGGDPLASSLVEVEHLGPGRVAL